RLAQMMVRPEPADRALRNADDAARLAVDPVLAVRARGDVDRVLEQARHAAVVFGRDEENAFGAGHPLAEREPFARRSVLEVVVEQRDRADLDDFEPKARRRALDHRLRGLAVPRFLAQAADENGDVAWRRHRESPPWRNPQA